MKSWSEGFPRRFTASPSTTERASVAYFATVVDGPRVGYLAGPYRTHGAALAAVEPCRKVAEAGNRDAVWYAFGTARVKVPTKVKGRLNDRVGYTGPGTLP